MSCTQYRLALLKRAGLLSAAIFHFALKLATEMENLELIRLLHLVICIFNKNTVTYGRK